jgi:hypothetical protein
MMRNTFISILQAIGGFATFLLWMTLPRHTASLTSTLILSGLWLGFLTLPLLYAGFVQLERRGFVFLMVIVTIQMSGMVTATVLYQQGQVPLLFQRLVLLAGLELHPWLSMFVTGSRPRFYPGHIHLGLVFAYVASSVPNQAVSAILLLMGSLTILIGTVRYVFQYSAVTGR